jgi:hypothetical protein
MQFHKEGDPEPSYGVKDTWDVALNAPGASQMRYLKQLMMSRLYFERIPAQDLLADKPGEKYDYLAATKDKDYAFIYTCNGSTMNVNLEKMHWNKLKASWFNPRNGSFSDIGTYKANSIKAFDPPGEKANGNDWVLILDRI